MVNDVHRIAHDLEELHSHDYGISGGSALQAGLTLPSVAKLGDTEETSCSGNVVVCCFSLCVPHALRFVP